MKKLITLLLCILCLASLQAELRVAGIFADNMVIQQNKPVKIWGWANAHEKISVRFIDKTVYTKALEDGSWEAVLPAHKYGGPYFIKVRTKKESIQFNNVLIGEVWLCAGQSNMEWTVAQSANAEKEIATATYPEIRSFRVPKGIKNEPIKNYSGKWEVCSPQTAGNFSGVAYFYARELYKKLNIPIGIINSSWGGTDIETWISENTFTALPANVKKNYYPEVMDNIDKYAIENKGSKEAFLKDLANDPALEQKWYNSTFDASKWSEIDVPKEWGATPLALVDGHVWFKYEISLPPELDGFPATLSLGTIDDIDITWVNGLKVGTNTGWDTPRLYNIAAGVLHAGKNDITVRITDNGGSGGMWGQPDDINLKIHGKKEVVYSLVGKWKYRESVTNSKYKVLEITPNMVYSSLYNTMINPIIKFRIKGVVWYQGENNVGRAFDYRTLFPAMINDWRNKWGYEFPFYWVQLANLYPLNENPVESDWAELREAQTMTLSLPKTGQAVICDIGNPNSIHPTNKQEVGRRLARIAFNKEYGNDSLIYSGPTFESMEKRGNKMIITMDTHGSGLVAHNKYGYLEGFAIADEGKKFQWAKAYIEGNKIIVYNDSIDNPTSVRYGWANNPGGNLFNRDGLPATPFRTDNWKGKTQK